MTNYIEVTGKTEDEAVKAGLAQLGLSRDEVSVEILEMAKAGFLGVFGASPAKVRLSYEVPDPAPTPPPRTEPPKPQKTESPKPAKTESPKSQSAAKPAPRAESRKIAPAERTERKTAPAPVSRPAPSEPPAEQKTADVPAERQSAETEPNSGTQRERAERYLRGLLDLMGVKAEIIITERENGGLNVELSGNGMGAVIGRRGETLDAIQHLVNYSVNRGSEKRMHISVDAENYRSKREDSLVRLAEKMAAKAIKYRRSMALEPMNSYERHVIHTALQNYEGVSTASVGEEPNRRVVVTYEKGGAPGNTGSSGKPKSREWA